MLEQEKVVSKNALLIFIKNPVLGKAKTRLAASIGDEKALAIYRRLLEHTRKETQALAADKLLFYSEKVENDAWPATDYQKKVQKKGDLGYKMKTAFSQAFDSGYQKVLIIGSDCAELKKEHLEIAFEALEKHNVVIGPANDGGYYLIGFQRLIHKVFENKKWSTAEVLSATLNDLERLNKTVFLLPELIDVDNYEDLQRIEWLKEF
ncbi:MAG: TIGR04282 family arsenosugar biosynthesis glycosyltransferase [Chitinophagales bacterium]